MTGSARARKVLAILTLVALAAAVPVLDGRAARADALDPDAARISAARHSLKWSWTPPGRSERYGHAEVLVRAPLSTVRKHVLDFGHYRDILPSRFKQSRIVGRGPDSSTDVYVQISVLHGLISLWNVARFTSPRETSPGVEVVQGRMIPGRGNVSDMDVVWTMRALGDQWTLLKFDILLKPGLPAPQSMIDEELRDAALVAVDSIHDRAQGNRIFAHWPEGD
jgi:hypothetical protein